MNGGNQHVIHLILLRKVLFPACYYGRTGSQSFTIYRVVSGFTPDHSHSRPDVLVAGWERGKPAAFDITVTSPLCPAFLGEASRVAAALAAETRNHVANGKKCQELGWTCVPMSWRHMAIGVKKLRTHFLAWLLVFHNPSPKLFQTSMDV